MLSREPAGFRSAAQAAFLGQGAALSSTPGAWWGLHPDFSGRPAGGRRRFRRSFPGKKGHGLPPQVQGHVSALGTRSRLPKWRDGPRGPVQTLRPSDPAQVSSRLRVHFLEENAASTSQYIVGVLCRVLGVL